MIALLPGEIIVDCFAGGGGASLGIEMALGRSPDIAINHDAEALAMHQANHPLTLHLCEKIQDVSPRRVVAGRPVGLLWASPDCKHFSKAKGGRPVDKKIRGLAWTVVRWARDVQPRVIFLENVEEFQTWGPLLPSGKPCPARKGETFQRWLTALRMLGYVVEYKELRASGYDTPTTRKRLFVIARRDGQATVWPKPTHGPGRSAPCLIAANCIDFSIPCPSIFGRKKPLKENTLRRIARGIQRYVIDAAEPFIIPTTHQGDRRTHPISEPMPTVTGAHRGELAIVAPLIARIGQTGGNGKYANDLREPVTTITSKGEHILVAPTLIAQGWGEREGQAPRCLDIQKPLGTVVGDGIKHAVVAAFLAKHYGDTGQQPGSRLFDPVGTVTACDHHSLVAVHLQRDFGKSVGSPADEPAPTTTAGGGGHQAIVASHMLKLRGATDTHPSTAQDLRDPVPTVTASGTHLAEVRAFLIQYNGDGTKSQDPSLLDPLHTVTTRDRFALVTVAGEVYAIVDIGMRMLTPRELARAQGFPDTYAIEVVYGHQRLSKTAQVRMIGNSVCPPLAAAIVRANFAAAVAPDAAWHPTAHVVHGVQLSLFDMPGSATA